MHGDYGDLASTGAYLPLLTWLQQPPTIKKAMGKKCKNNYSAILNLGSSLLIWSELFINQTQKIIKKKVCN